jgi:hypothetical protein
MKRFYLALIIFLLSVSNTIVSTRAVWTDIVSVSSNQVITGTTDLQVSTDDGSTWSTTSMSSVFNLTGIMPGLVSSGTYAFSLKNLSSSPLNFSLGGRITPSTVIAGAPDKTKLLIQIYDIDTPADATAWKSLAEWEAASAGGITFNSILNNAATKRYGIKVELDSTANDTWQGKTVIFSVEIMGIQI